jgi:hypothetical protein
MPRTRRASRKQRGGFLDWLFGEKKANNATTTASNGQDTLAEPVSANTTYTNAAAVGGKRRRSSKSRKSKKAHRNRKAKANRKSRMNRKASRKTHRKSRRNTRRH